MTVTMATLRYVSDIQESLLGARQLGQESMEEFVNSRLIVSEAGQATLYTIYPDLAWCYMSLTRFNYRKH